MMNLNVEPMRMEQMADLLSTSEVTKTVQAGELRAQFLKSPEGEVVLIEGLNGEGLLFSRLH